MTKDEALKLALEALEISCKKYGNVGGKNTDWGKWDAAITAIKEALAQPEQLVAHREAFWCVDLTCKKCYGADFRFKHKSSVDKKSLTTPAQPEDSTDLTIAYMAGLHDGKKPKRSWVGLTEKERRMFASWLDNKTDDEVFNAIEAKLKEKNT